LENAKSSSALLTEIMHENQRGGADSETSDVLSTLYQSCVKYRDEIRQFIEDRANGEGNSQQALDEELLTTMLDCNENINLAIEKFEKNATLKVSSSLPPISPQSEYCVLPNPTDGTNSIKHATRVLQPPPPRDNNIHDNHDDDDDDDLICLDSPIFKKEEKSTINPFDDVCFEEASTRNNDHFEASTLPHPSAPPRIDFNEELDQSVFRRTGDPFQELS
jgi:hypothetical protein